MVVDKQAISTARELPQSIEVILTAVAYSNDTGDNAVAIGRGGAMTRTILV